MAMRFKSSLNTIVNNRMTCSLRRLQNTRTTNRTGEKLFFEASLMMSVGIAYTEQSENRGTMILDGVCYSALMQLCSVILSRITYGRAL